MRSIPAMRSKPGCRSRVAACAVALGTAACGEPLAEPIAAAHGDDTPRSGGTLQLASIGDVRGLDPAAASDGVSTSILEHLYAGLVDFGDDGAVVVDAAMALERSSDGTRYEFTLREGVRFHDGDELTAADVKRSVERALHPETPCVLAGEFGRLVGASAYTSGKADAIAGVEVLGRYRVRFRLSEPDATFLSLLALPALRPVCKSGGARYSPTFHPCGAGPFKLGAGGWERGRSLTIVRHEQYFRPGRPYLDAISWSFGMNPVTQRLKFERGELDFLRDLTQPDLDRFARDGRWKPFGAAETEKTVVGEVMNTELAPFDNVEVRRAVAAAIDREHYRKLKPRVMSVATQLFPPAIPGYDPAFEGQRFDHTRALEHMRRAGYPYEPERNAFGYPGTIAYYTFPQGLNLLTAQLLQQDLARIGLRVELRVVSYPTYMALAQRRHTVAFSSQGWQEDYPDPSNFLEPLFGKKAINETDSTNTAFFSNERLEAILGRGRRELDPRTRAALYAEGNRIVCDEAPWAFTHFHHFYEVRQPVVRGYAMHPVWAEDVRRVWLDRPVSSRPFPARRLP